MPRNRMIKPDFWNDEKLGSESESVQLVFIGTWNFSDDYGVVRANSVWLKNQIFPYKHALRIEVFAKWLEALEGHEMLIPFTIRGEKYYFIRTFRLHQKVEKPSKTRNCSEDELQTALKQQGYQEQEDESWERVGEWSGSSGGVVGDKVKLSISEVKLNGIAKAIPEKAGEGIQKFTNDQVWLEKEFKELEISKDNKEAWTIIKAWIQEKKPQFVEPYAVLWNVFASFYGFPSVTKVNPTRRKKFQTRIKEDGFDFFEILAKAKKSEFLKTSSFFNFDWVLENETNYLKIIEENYR